MDVESVLDLLHLYPRRVHDRTAVTALEDLEIGTETTVFGSTVKVVSRLSKARKKMVIVTVQGGEARLDVTFFNQPWREKQLAEGTEVAMFGKVETFAGKLRMTNPIVDVIGRAGEARTGRIVAVYPQSAKADISSWEIAPAVAVAVEFAGDIYDPLDEAIRAPMKLVDRTTAIHDIHLPETIEHHRRAERRLRFDEFLVAQVGLVARKRALAAAEIGVRHAPEVPLLDALVAQGEREIRIWPYSEEWPGTSRVIPRPAGAPAFLWPEPAGRWLGAVPESNRIRMWPLDSLPRARPVILRRSEIGRAHV
mgnify:CR=1 FL=1